MAGFLTGLVVGGACATSDQVLEKQRRKELMGGDACTPGRSQQCYEGPRDTAGRGACTFGQRTCGDRTWGACEGQVLPSKEICNEVDDDCDGIVDNGFERSGAACFFEGAKGACRTQGTWSCTADGTRSECDAPVVRPQPEVCDGIDNDCDGVVDEDSVPADQQSCTTGKAGVCGPGTNKCIRGKLTCIQNVSPGPEICNKQDDNCNGEVDEDCVTEEEFRRQMATTGGQK
jgi:hypothetical protein